MVNRLDGESSPYLLQHRDNPVDWYPWGSEAFEVAKASGKPIFVSIGYAACHWCHVMAHESFEDENTARLMNELFVNIKVDREERPDVDAVYMSAIHVMGEGGGWPLSAFCDSGGAPYFLGTYFPPEERYGRPSFSRVLKTMAQVWAQQRDQVEHNIAGVLQGLAQIDQHHRGSPEGVLLDEGDLVAAGRTLLQSADPVHGGFGSRPKFPSSSSHELLARVSTLPFGEPAENAFLLQCRSMARGGIYDHLGGGFARYSVDERWLVPHFEKMLYDNAQLLAIYADAEQIAPDPEWRRVIAETVGYLGRELSDPAGGLYASQDADSEGEEGRFYVWTQAEIHAVLGPARAIQFCHAYGVCEHGNFEGGRTVLERVSERGTPADEDALAEMRRDLFEARGERPAPATDTKVLSGWNGLAITGLVKAARATANPDALAMARRVADFLTTIMAPEPGRMHRVYRDGVVKLDGTLDDYAFVAQGLMLLAEDTGDAHYWEKADALVRTILRDFMEQRDGAPVLYMIPAHERGLIHRPESNQDGAIPAGASVAVECLVRLGKMIGDSSLVDLADAFLRSRWRQAIEHPHASARLLCAAHLYLRSSELVISDGEGRGDLIAAANRTYAPGLLRVGPWAHRSFIEGTLSHDSGRAQAHVCRGQTCSPPVADPERLTALLAARD